MLPDGVCSTGAFSPGFHPAGGQGIVVVAGVVVPVVVVPVRDVVAVVVVTVMVASPVTVTVAVVDVPPPQPATSTARAETANTTIAARIVSGVHDSGRPSILRVFLPISDARARCGSNLERAAGADTRGKPHY
jgi:hypothetical protein